MQMRRTSWHVCTPWRDGWSLTWARRHTRPSAGVTPTSASASPQQLYQLYSHHLHVGSTRTSQPSPGTYIVSLTFYVNTLFDRLMVFGLILFDETPNWLEQTWMSRNEFFNFYCFPVNLLNFSFPPVGPCQVTKGCGL